MDPRRQLDEKLERLRASQVPLVETYRETVLVEQPIGQPETTEIIVIRLHVPALKLYGIIALLFGVALIIGYIIH